MFHRVSVPEKLISKWNIILTKRIHKRVTMAMGVLVVKARGVGTKEGHSYEHFP